MIASARENLTTSEIALEIEFANAQLITLLISLILPKMPQKTSKKKSGSLVPPYTTRASDGRKTKRQIMLPRDGKPAKGALPMFIQEKVGSCVKSKGGDGRRLDQDWMVRRRLDLSLKTLWYLRICTQSPNWLQALKFSSFSY